MATESEKVDIETLHEILDLAKSGLKAKKETQQQKLHVEVVKHMLTLATSGFGLVAALAWNNLIQEIVNTYIKMYLPISAGIISLLIYAMVVTGLAVLVTLELSKLLKKIS